MPLADADIPLRTAIADRYAGLSHALRAAADFVVDHRFAVATRSLRSVAQESGLSTASFSRLARAIGFADYEALRDRAREEIANGRDRFSEKARQLHDRADEPLLPRQVRASHANIETLLETTVEPDLAAAVKALTAARNVVVVGAMSSAPFADYLAYLASWFDGRWTVAGRNGTALGSALTRLDARDAVVVISKAPYARRSVVATEMAAEQGATVVLLTDSHSFPAIASADHVYIQEIESPHFFSSYAATLVLIETIAGMLVAQAGTEAVDEIRRVMERNRRLEEFASLA